MRLPLDFRNWACRWKEEHGSASTSPATQLNFRRFGIQRNGFIEFCSRAPEYAEFDPLSRIKFFSQIFRGEVKLLRRNCNVIHCISFGVAIGERLVNFTKIGFH